MTINNNIKGLTIIAEPSDTLVPTYTMNYVATNSDYVTDINACDSAESKSMHLHYLDVQDSTLFITEILFQFTEIESNQNWYYCYYLDFDLHGNVILLNERDVPQDLLLNVQKEFF